MSYLISFFLFISILISNYNLSASTVDLMYMPKYGEIELDINYSRNSLSYNNRTTQNRTINFKEEDDYSLMSVFVTYSPFNELLLGVGLDYKLAATFTQSSQDGSAPVTSESSGLMEPLIFGRFRILKEKEHFVDVDGVLSISPSIDDGEMLRSKKDVSAKRGGGLYSGTLFVGKTWADFLARGHLKVALAGERTLTNTVYNNKGTSIESHTDIEIGMTGQLKLSEVHALEAGLDYLTVGEIKEKVILGNIDTRYDSHSEVILRAGYKGEFVPDFFTGYLNLSLYNISDYNVSTSGVISENIDVKKTIIQLGGTFKF